MMFNRYFIITVAFIGALVVFLTGSSKLLAGDLEDLRMTYQVAEASDESAEGEEDIEFC